MASKLVVDVCCDKCNIVKNTNGEEMSWCDTSCRNQRLRIHKALKKYIERQLGLEAIYSVIEDDVLEVLAPMTLTQLTIIRQELTNLARHKHCLTYHFYSVTGKCVETDTICYCNQEPDAKRDTPMALDMIFTVLDKGWLNEGLAECYDDVQQTLDVNTADMHRIYNAEFISKCLKRKCSDGSKSDAKRRKTCQD